MKQRLQGVVTGVLMTVLMLGTVTAFAAPVRINVAINGVVQQFTDESHPFLAENGMVYVPIQSIVNALGMDFAWEVTTNTASLTNRVQPANPAPVSVPTMQPATALPTTISNRQFDVTINSIEAVDTIEFATRGGTGRFNAHDGEKFVVLDVSVRNTGTRADRFIIPSMIPSIVYAGEFTYRPVQLASHPDSLHGVSINPLSTRRGVIAFRIPDEVLDSGRPLVFRVDTNTSRSPDSEFSFTLN